MSLKFLNGEISEDDYRKNLPELLKEAAKTNQETRILSLIEDESVDSLEKYFGYNNICKHHYTFKNDRVLEEIEIFVISLETGDPKEKSYTGSHPYSSITYSDFVNKLKKKDLKILAENLAKLGF